MEDATKGENHPEPQQTPAWAKTKRRSSRIPQVRSCQARGRFWTDAARLGRWRGVRAMGAGAWLDGAGLMVAIMLSVDSGVSASGEEMTAMLQLVCPRLFL